MKRLFTNKRPRYCLWAVTMILFLPIQLGAQDKDPMDGAKGTSYYASNNGSDHYLYATWSGIVNACVAFPVTTLVIDYYDYDNSMGRKYNVANVFTYSGTAYSNAVGPSRTATFYFQPHHTGWFCDYWDSKVGKPATTARIKPPRDVSVSYDDYDTKVEITWNGSLTDVPTSRYDYRIYRDGVLMAAVPHSARSWNDATAVPGVEYQYSVCTHSAHYGHKESIRVGGPGKVFDLNVRTESLSSGVRIEWDNPGNKINMQNFTIERREENGTPEFLKNVDSPIADKWSDLDQGGIPIPGYNYTYIVTPWTDTHIYRADSAMGNRNANGSFSGTVTSPTGGPVSGVVVCADRISAVPQGATTSYCDTTDGQGKFYIQNVYYYDSANFSITPYKEDHGFSPAADTFLLKLSNPSWSNINFTDTSSFTVSGRVYQIFNGDSCYEKDVEILIDDLQMGYTTNSDGRFNLTVERTGEFTFKPEFFDHGFSPAERTLFVGDDIADVFFEDTTTYLLEGDISGPCDIYIGKADLRIYGKTGACFDTVITSDNMGHYSVRLPAWEYYVDMQTFYPDDPLVVTATEVEEYFATTRTVDLTQDDNSLNYIYRKAPEVQVSGFEIYGCGDYDGIPILQQAMSYNLTINVLENFGGFTCNTNTGYIIVRYTPGEGEIQTDTIDLVDGSALFELVPDRPNIVAPYLNLLEVTAFVGEEMDYYSQEIMVTGNRPREATFVSVSPEIPFLILRDPPGDASYSYFSEGNTYESAFSISGSASASLNAWVAVKLGAEFEAGQFVFVKSKIWGQVKSSLEIGASLKASTELGLSITNNERFSTSGNDNITGEAGDVFAGASLNMVYALTDVLSYDPDNCMVNSDVDLVMAPDGFETTFIYTENHIREVLIPELELIRDLYAETGNDSADIYQNQVKTWQQTLALNTRLKAEAELLENRSFSSLAPYESSEEITLSNSSVLEFSMWLDQTTAIEAGFEFGGSGISGGVDVNFRLEMGSSFTTGSSNTTTTGYVLADDDVGDSFSVDISKDLTYGTPVFGNVTGRSSCPWEPGTQPRDGVQLTSDSYSQYVSNPDDPAVFKLNLGNTSQSDEDRTYDLVFLQESNPDGAVITLGGSQVQGGIPTPYTVPAGSSIEAEVTVSRGQNAYDYNNLIFELSSQCEGAISDEVALSAHFQSNCSDITLSKPLDPWLVSGISNHLLDVQLKDYDLATLESATVQYSIKDANSWNTTAFYDASQLDQDVTNLNISFGGIEDGAYDIRAKVACSDIIKYSEIKSGLVDRTPPAVFGLPEPVDGVLEAGDLISVTFDEEINCLKVLPGNISMTNIGTGAVITTMTGCSGDKIIILADTTGLTFEEDTFQIEVTGIEDLYGNVAGDITWNFNVPGPEAFETGDDDDTDGDGVVNSLDNCPIAYNPGQTDMDNDGMGDYCDPDIDGDDVLNETDNCPFTSNPNQEDSNSNGIGDVCDVTGIDRILFDNGFEILDNYPNPFSQYTTLTYRVPVTSKVDIHVYNFTGQLVDALSAGYVPRGINETTWYSGAREAGIYFYTISFKTPDGKVFTGRKKMILFR